MCGADAERDEGADQHAAQDPRLAHAAQGSHRLKLHQTRSVGQGRSGRVTCTPQLRPFTPHNYDIYQRSLGVSPLK